MGGGGSSCSPANIPNLKARSFFESILQTSAQVPESVQKTKQFKTLVRVIYDNLKRAPEREDEFGVVITGSGVGPVFVEHFIFHIGFPRSLTKLSLRKCSLKGSHALSIAAFLRDVKSLQQFDCGENDFGDRSTLIIEAAIDHPSLTSLQLEGCHVSDSASSAITCIISNSRKFRSLCLAPCKFSKKHQDEITTALKKNYYLDTVSLCDSLDEVTQRTTEKNKFIGEIVDSIARSPFQRQFRAKIESFKSVKGREMVMGRAGQKEKMKGTELFKQLEEADQRAKTTENAETAAKTELFRSGHAEMIGRRPNMEDVSILLNDVPEKGSMLFGLFDGHGGREAAEFASSNLPKAIQDRLKATSRFDDAYTAAFRSLQMDMKPWCVYVGTTAVVAVIDGSTLTVANVGDSRCVLCRDGKAVRLSVDHKPDLPEETAYIQSKGGFVRDGRVGGMLAVSRALGDGFLGDAVNPTPFIRRVELTEDDAFLILACDGVWDVMTDQEACELVAPEIDPLQAAKKLRDQAFERNSLDNISVIVVFLSEAFANRVIPE
ncbi:protein phosphatase 2C [Tritrichomonas foetus]|uniref:Protein phosphatase 2C n=1 Tax=Tritrichomonas foetus TaxID=1144522 RepID=A0A1J4KIH7_9EUKA|nr:protein phosphatase 2C [Tritrichomonas foetus]|eukprot:OHT10744.1 protein phosphatase 2C [Tritrichomonas foetus]